MIQNLFKRSRVSIVFGALFLFLSCSSQTPQIWLLRDIQSLDAKVMNTVQWLKIEKSNYKFLNKALKKKLELYRKTNFIVYQKIEKEIEIIDKNLKEVEAYLTKQKKIARQIRRRPKMKIFDKHVGGKPKNKIFSKKNIGITRIDKSDNAIKIINSLENNSARIISNQNMHDSSIEQLLKIFNKESYDLIFIRREVKQYNQSLKDLMYSRKLLNNILDEFNLKISDALLVSEESSYSSNIIDLSRKIELYNEQMNEFENYVRSLESIAGKECRGLVYLIKKEEKKDYKEKYLNDLSNYNFILKEIPKLLSSI